MSSFVLSHVLVVLDLGHELLIQLDCSIGWTKHALIVE